MEYKKFLLPEYLPAVSKEIFFLFIANYIIFPDLFYYCNNNVVVEIVFIYYVESVL